MGNDERKKYWLRKIAAFLGGPLALLFTAVAVIVGVLGDNLVEKYNQRPDAYLISAVIVGVAYLIIIIVTLVVATLVFSKDRNEEIRGVIENQPQTCKEIQKNLVAIQNAAGHLQSVLVGSVVEKSVMSGNEVDSLEASVTNGKRIIIFTSKFILEGKDEFSKVIIQNFRKGVKYEYLIPDASSSPQGALDKYWDCVKSWYDSFSCFLANVEAAQKLLGEATSLGSVSEWNSAYKKLIDDFILASSKQGVQRNKEIKRIRAAAQKLFCSQMQQFALEPSLFFVTVAMYQQPDYKWRAIIKLPTEKPEENFVAFSLDHANITERDSFFSSIQSLYAGKTPVPIDSRVLSN
jgi:hypothetical protein